MAGKGESPKVGIELGTLYPCVGLSKTPSYVAFTGNECLIGDAANNQVARNPTNSIFEKTTGVKGRSLLPMISGDCPMKRLREWSRRQRVTRLKMMIT
ncbi:hypothetical protein CMV_017393 [Castanea mollissima]|uniref:Heat shock protein 70 n=1 Tax=Castanea mollissima TaxID=60419 RepID=A0A8J4VDS0_9ROSI|nr:hypothetical protein CMV_017393 [Castanea mollissima]